MPLTRPTDPNDPNAPLTDERPAEENPNDERPEENAQPEGKVSDMKTQVTEGKPTDPSVRAPNLPGAFDENTAWQDYAVQAIHGLYPHLRRGMDFEWGRPADDPQGDQRLLHMDDKFAAIDMGKVEEAARKLVGANPYLDYKAQKPLHAGSEKESEYKG